MSFLKRLTLWAVGLGLVAWTLSTISLGDAWSAVRALDASAVGVLVLVNLAALVIFALRWWVILRGLDIRLGLMRASAYRLAAFGFAYFTPGPQVGGEPVQVLLVESKHGVGRERAVASVALDRLLDAVVNFGYLGIALGVLVSPLASVLAVLAPWYLVALARGARPLSRWGGRWPLLLSSEAEAGRFCRHKPFHLAAALGATLLSWAVIFGEYWLVARFLGAPLSWYQLVLGLTAARIAYLLFFPAAVGVFEAGQVAAVAAMGLPPHLGLSVSLVVRARDVTLGLAGVLMGLSCLAPLRRAGIKSPRWRSSTAPTSGDL